MKIKLLNRPVKSTTFSELDNGTCFELCNVIYLKLNHRTAVELETGKPKLIMSDTYVIPHPEATLTIESI